MGYRTFVYEVRKGRPLQVCFKSMFFADVRQADTYNDGMEPFLQAIGLKGLEVHCDSLVDEED